MGKLEIWSKNVIIHFEYQQVSLLCSWIQVSDIISLHAASSIHPCIFDVCELKRFETSSEFCPGINYFHYIIEIYLMLDFSLVRELIMQLVQQI